MTAWIAATRVTAVVIAATLASTCVLARYLTEAARMDDEPTDDDTTWFADLPAAW